MAVAFTGQRIVITGGSSGIGKQIAADFLRRGAHVTIVANNSIKLERTRAELSLIASSVCASACDVGRSRTSGT